MSRPVADDHLSDVDARLLARLRRGPRPMLIQPTTGPAPLSFGQERMWLAEMLEPEAGYYNCAYLIRLRGALDVPALRWTVAEVVRRHQVLRTVFERTGRSAVQRLLDVSAVPVPYVDHGSAGEIDARAHELAALPYRLDREPPMRCEIVRLGERDHALLLCLHHVAIDGWSEAVLHREISALYETALSRGDSALPVPAPQYRDYAAWQRARAQRGELDGDVRYWRDRLAGVAPYLRLPFDRAPGPESGSGGAMLTVRVGAADTAALRDHARRERTTLFVLLLSGLAALLAGRSGQDGVVIGVPVAGRSRPELEPLIGFFVNTLALRLDVGVGEPWRALLDRTRVSVREALDHQDAPFDQVVKAVRPARAPGRQPLVQVLFQLHNVPEVPLRLPDVEVETRQIFPDALQLELALVLVEDGDGLSGHWRFRTGLFDPGTVRLLHESLLGLLRQAIAAPDRPVVEDRSTTRQPLVDHGGEVGGAA